VGLSNLAHAQQPDFTGPIQALEEKIDPLNDKQAEQSARLKALAKQVEALAKSLDAKADISSVRLAESPEPKESTEEKVEEPEKAALVEVTLDEPIAKKTRAPRKPRTPEPRLLQRAIEQKQDKSSEAVSRIIESKSKKTPPEDAPAVEPTQEAPKPETDKSAKVNKPKEPSPPAEEPKIKPEPPLEEAVPEPLDGVIIPVPAKPTTEEPETQPVESEDMFGDVVPSTVKKRVRTKKSDSAVVASVFIGIGNKPFVRGSGAGLNWDKGIAMEFVEIGKWQWIPPAELKEPVELQLFRNDEDADSTGKYTLEPGQQLDLSPVF